MLCCLPAATMSTGHLGLMCPSSSTWREQGLALPQCGGFCHHHTLLLFLSRSAAVLQKDGIAHSLHCAACPAKSCLDKIQGWLC